MRFPKYGNYSLDVSGNVLEVFATGAWNLKTTEFFVEEMHELIAKFDNKPWAALMDGRRWVLSTPECQTRLAEAIKVNISRGLTRSAYVLDTGMVRRAQLERTHPKVVAVTRIMLFTFVRIKKTRIKMLICHALLPNIKTA